VEERTFVKQDREEDIAILVSHDLQRERKKACGKGMLCVKRMSGGAWGKGLARTSYAQWTGLPQLAQRGQERGDEEARGERISGCGSRGGIVPIPVRVAGDGSGLYGGLNFVGPKLTVESLRGWGSTLREWRASW
jgi:hypothetical protein